MHLQHLLRRPVVQAFHYAPLQSFLEPSDISARVSGNVGAFGNVCADDLVPVLDTSFFPEFVRVAEVDLDAEPPLQILVADEKDVVVPGDRFHLRKPLFHAADRIRERSDRNRKYFL